MFSVIKKLAVLFILYLSNVFIGFYLLPLAGSLSDSLTLPVFLTSGLVSSLLVLVFCRLLGKKFTFFQFPKSLTSYIWIQGLFNLGIHPLACFIGTMATDSGEHPILHSLFGYACIWLIPNLIIWAFWAAISDKNNK